MLKKWEVQPAPNDKNPGRHKLLIKGEMKDIFLIVKKLGSVCSRPEKTAGEYDFIIYISKLEIAKILRAEGYIANFKVAEEGAKKTIKIYLKYDPANAPVISAIERVSRPGCRVYVGQRGIPKVLGGMGITILTTPRGVMPVT